MTVEMDSNEEKLTILQKDLSEILECGICKNFFDDPRMLPCIHSFCLGCLRRSFEQSNEQDPGGVVVARLRCPLCRRRFVLPAEGFAGLQKNFFLTRLIDTMKIVNPDSGENVNVCDPCRENPTPGVDTPPAESYCHECREKLCPSCAFYHQRRKHRLTAVGDAGSDDVKPSLPTYYCSQHNRYTLDLFCSDCSEAVCPMCFIEKHQGHGRRAIDEASKEFRERIQNSSVVLLKSRDVVRNCIQRLEQEKNAVLEKSTDLERQVIASRDEVKKLADQCADHLLQSISDSKTEILKQITSQLDDNSFKLAALDNYVLYCRGVSEKGSDVDVCRAGNWLETRYAEIQQMQISEDSEPSSIFQKTFKKTDVAALLSLHQLSIIGTLQDEENTVKADLEASYSESIQEDNNSDRHLESSDRFLRSGSSDLNADAHAAEPQCIRVIKTLFSSAERREIQGIAILGDDLFVVHDRCKEIEVYDVTTFNRTTTFQVNKLVDPGDIVAAKGISCLYIVDWKDSERDNEIISIKPTGNVIKRWMTPNDCSWLSVTYKDNVILTLLQRNAIHEYSRDGKLLSAVKIPPLSGISKIWHAIKLNAGDFIVSHGVEGNLGVCRVTPNGNVINLFSGSNCNFQLLHSSVYLAEDWNGSIFVVDQTWKQVLRLNSALEFQKIFLSRSHKLRSPRRICFADSRGLLFVGDEKGKVLIFSIL